MFSLAAASLAAAAAPHPANWVAGWVLVLLAFISGALIGVGYHRDDFLGGYASFRRRMTRLGHIALAALGMLNVLFALSPVPVAGTTATTVASVAFIAGGGLMPLVCFLSAWREPLRHLFFLPVASLILAVVFTLLGASS
jgi:hypothetical protein